MIEITTAKVVNLFGIAMDVASLVRRGIITDAEGHALANLRYEKKRAELETRKGKAS